MTAVGLKPVSDDAGSVADQAAGRMKNRGTQVRHWFVRRPDPTLPPPPLARMLQGGRGGEIRLKTYLAMLWLAGGGRQHTVEFTARAFARLLDLPDPTGAGARRISDAFRWLEREGFVQRERRPGRDPSIELLSDLGSGKPYLPPGAAEKDPQAGKARPENTYFTLPVKFWTGGWAVALPGPALAMLLVTMNLGKGQKWVSPQAFGDRYALSEDTRARGFAVLHDAGLVVVGKQPVSRDRDDFERRRIRNNYAYQPATLERGVRGLVS